jgi:hypothetical protein
MSTPFFSLIEHRKAIARNVIVLSEDLSVIPMEQSNEDELHNQLRQLEASKVAKKVNALIEEAEAADADGDDELAKAKIKEAHDLTAGGLTLLLSTLRTLVCTEDGKKPTLEQLRKAIGSQDECQAVLQVVGAARSVDPMKQTPGGGTPT